MVFPVSEHLHTVCEPAFTGESGFPVAFSPPSSLCPCRAHPTPTIHPSCQVPALRTPGSSLKLGTQGLHTHCSSHTCVLGELLLTLHSSAQGPYPYPSPPQSWNPCDNTHYIVPHLHRTRPSPQPSPGPCRAGPTPGSSLYPQGPTLEGG